MREMIAQGEFSEKDEHMIAAFEAASSGPTLIVVGSVHGNEPAGALALRSISKSLSSLSSGIRGRIYFLAGNTRALAQKARFIDRDLNRLWTEENLSAVRSKEFVEDLELDELAAIFDRVLGEAKAEVYVLDLHTTSAGGATFATVGDTLRNRHFAQQFPVTILLGIEEQLSGTMLEHLNNKGAVTLGFEGGQHDSAEAVENHAALVWLALTVTGILDPNNVPGLDRHRRLLALSTAEAKILEVRYREAIAADDNFQMKPGFANFDRIERGQVLASNKFGPVTAVESGMILMPLYQKLGEDGFFIVRRIASFWLLLSEVLRRLKIPKLLPILPGVRSHPTDSESLIVNTQVARLLPLHIFHLLGFRRRSWQKDRLVVSRRRFDTESPFVKVRR